MSNIITEVRQALLARLGTILTRNGYRTNIGGAVKAGWFNEIAKPGSVPATGMVVVQRGKGKEPKAGAHELMMHIGFSVIGAVTAGVEGYEPAIEDIELDLLQCLTPIDGVFVDWLPRGAPGLAVGAPDPYPPGDGLPAATVLIPIHIRTIVEASGSTYP
ncbi:hypothetical protein [Pseudomonas sp. SO81]|uniref:hypothetical protein n=1 Tax=Pseudomonas sp. SO81 TaxID=2983246 RepID=UPI0025A41832|nr:hypothetical protein [Pseudomonas sp. SO81]WJN60932.1 hypothetical protein OH686_19480 [Pseudomonas sp. SO81]